MPDPPGMEAKIDHEGVTADSASKEARNRLSGPALGFGLLLVAFGPTIASLPATWSNYNEHGYFVGLLVAWLIWRDRAHFRVTTGRRAPDGLLGVGVLSLLWLGALVAGVNSGHQALWLLIMAGWALLVFGWSRGREIGGIAATWLLAVPIWDILTPTLQRATTVVAGGVTQLSGIAAEIGWDYIALSSGTLLIEEGCAGYQYFMAALVLGAAYGHLFVRGWQTKLQIVVAAAAVAVLGNWIRVSSLVFIGEASQMQSSLLEDHVAYGWAIFTVLLVPTYLIARRLELRGAAKTAAAGASEATAEPVADTVRSPARFPMAPTLAALVGPVVLLAFGLVPRSSEISGTFEELALLGADVEGVQPAEGIPSWRPDFAGIDAEQTWLVDYSGVPIEVTRNYFIDQRQDEELIGSGNRVAPVRELVAERYAGPFGPTRRIVRETVVETEAGPRLVWYWYRVAGLETAFSAQGKVFEILSFLRRSGPSELITVSTPCAEDNCDVGAWALRELSGLGPAAVPEGAEAVSLLGGALFAPELPPEVLEIYLARYAEAEEALAADPEDADALIWMGRRTAYLGQYRAAIDIYSHALGLHPDDARLFRHRGHRHLTVREPRRAVADFRRALALVEGQPDQIEPDGLPNRLNVPTSTLHFNIWYHLALAYYVQGDFERAIEAQRACLAVSRHPDSVVATSYWLYMTARRLGLDEEAAEVLAGVSSDMEIIESTSYLDLLLLFKGERTLEELMGPEDSQPTLQSTTTAYGVGVWHMLEGRPDEARRVWSTMMDSGTQWAAFGYLAAESELALGTAR